MKIYRKIVIDIDTGKMLHEDSFNYLGPVSECKGGSTTTNTQDEAYNEGLLELQQIQSGWGEEAWNMYKFGTAYDPTEQVTGYYDDSGQFVEETPGDGGLVLNPDYKPAEYRDARQSMQEFDAGVPARKELVRDEQGPKYIQTPGREYVTTTRGDIGQYDDSVTSEREYLQNIVEENQALLGLQSLLDKEQLGYQTDVVGAKRGLLGKQTAFDELGLDYKTDVMTADRGLITPRADLERRKIGAESSLLDSETELKGKRLDYRKDFLDEAGEGIDIGGRMDEAQAGVQHGFKTARESTAKDIASYGLDPNSGKFASSSRGFDLSEAAGIAGARTKAKRSGEDEDFRRKTVGLTI